MAYKWRINIFCFRVVKRDLTEQVAIHKILKRTGDIGAGTNYVLIGSQLAQTAKMNCTLNAPIAQRQQTVLRRH